MLIPDFTIYRLALLEGDNLIYSSVEGGLRPLCDALGKFKGKSGLTLHDKIMGLAAARLTARSGIVSDIFALVTSLPAKEFLDETGIRLIAFDYVAHILTPDKSSICPFELLAMSTSDPDVLLRKIRSIQDRQCLFHQTLTR